MMDYAAGRPSRYLSKAPAPQTRGNMAARSRYARKTLGCGASSPGTITRPACMISRSHGRTRFGARRRHRHYRRQPAGLVAAEVATHAIGAMSLGLYRDVLDEEPLIWLSYGEARLVFAEDEEQVDNVLARDRPPNLSLVYSDRAGCGNMTTRA